MKINKIKLHNFKLFSNETFEFNSEFNLLIGVNGSGKTSLLRAIAVSLAGWANAYIKSNKNLRPIEVNEIREIQIDNRFDKSKSVSIIAFGEAVIIDRVNVKKNAIVEWSRERDEGYDTTRLSGKIKYSGWPTHYNLNFESLGSDILEYIENGNTFDLPIIAFYECDRLWLAKDELNLESSATQQYSRFDPYIDCFHTGADHQAIGQWLLKHELTSIQQKKKSPVLLAIQNAAISALENCIGFKFDIEQSRVIVEFKDKNVPFEHLSDGQRTILGLFCDIARRAAILNPHLGGEANAKVTGIVLIDELDLHLHPKWQRRVIEDLRKVFPKVQFICSSHSPFLIQSLRKTDELIMLDGDPLSDYANIGIETIVKNMGVTRPDVSLRYEEQKEVAKTFLQLLDESSEIPDEKQQMFKRQLIDKIAPYADNAAYQAFLELQYASKYGENFEAD